MVIKFNEVIIEDIPIPNFVLNEGELISLMVESSEFGSLLQDYLIGKKNHSGIEMFKPLIFVENITFKAPLLDRLLNKRLVRHFIKRTFKGIAYNEEELLEKVQVKPNWTIKGLGFNPTKIFATLLAIRKNKYIIYTTSGMDWEGAERLHQIVKEEVNKSNGAAIEINISAINGNRAIPKTEKVIEIKIPSHNNTYKPLGGSFEFKLKSHL